MSTREPSSSQRAPLRDLTNHLVIGYEEHHALVPEGLRKTPGGKIEFVKHQVPKPGSPASPITSFLNGESDLFLTNKCQLAYLQGCVKIATYGGSSPEYLLAPVTTLKELQRSPLMHGLLLGLEKMHRDLMIFPVFGLKYQSLDEYIAELNKQTNPYDHSDMD